MVKYKIVDWDKFVRANFIAKGVPTFITPIIKYLFKEAEEIEFDYVQDNVGLKSSYEYVLDGLRKAEERNIDSKTNCTCSLYKNPHPSININYNYITNKGKQ